MTRGAGDGARRAAGDARRDTDAARRDAAAARREAAEALADLTARRRQVLAQAGVADRRWRLPAEMALTFLSRALKDMADRRRRRQLRAAVAVAGIVVGQATHRRARVRLEVDWRELACMRPLLMTVALALVNTLGRRRLTARARRAGLPLPHTAAGAVAALTIGPLSAVVVRRVIARTMRPHFARDVSAPLPEGWPASPEPLLADRTALSIAGLLGACRQADETFLRDAVAAGPGFAERLGELENAGLVEREPTRIGRISFGTWLALTPRGQAALLSHAAALRALRDGA